MDTNNQSVIIDGANPSMLWYNIADYIDNLSKYMVKTYKQRQRSNKQITWGELDKVNQDLHNQLDIIISGDRNVKTISENREMNKKQVIRLTENQLHQIVKDSVKKVLKESLEIDTDLSGYGGEPYDDYENHGEYSLEVVGKPYEGFVGIDSLEIALYRANQTLTRLPDVTMVIKYKNTPVCKITHDGITYTKDGRFESWKTYYRR